MSFITDLLNTYQFPSKDVDALGTFISRDGFIILEQEEFESMTSFFSEYPDDFSELLPIMTDNNSNYICVYYVGNYQYQVALLNHDEMDLLPIYSNIYELITVIQRHPECYDIEDILSNM